MSSFCTIVVFKAQKKGLTYYHQVHQVAPVIRGALIFVLYSVGSCFGFVCMIHINICLTVHLYIVL